MSRPALPKYSYTFSTLAYALPLLHAARYPSSTTVGLLLGRPSSSPSTSTSESSTASPIEVSVEDAIPLLHHYTSLSAMMEVTLQLVAEYVGMKGAGGWRVVGYYEARVEGEGLSRSGERVLRALREEWEGVFALVVDNEKLASGSWPYDVYIPTSTSGVAPKLLSAQLSSPPEGFALSSPSLPTQVLRAIREDGVHTGIRDFDDHLEDSNADWLENTAVRSILVKMQ